MVESAFERAAKRNEEIGEASKELIDVIIANVLNNVDMSKMSPEACENLKEEMRRGLDFKIAQLAAGLDRTISEAVEGHVYEIHEATSKGRYGDNKHCVTLLLDDGSKVKAMLNMYKSREVRVGQQISGIWLKKDEDDRAIPKEMYQVVVQRRPGLAARAEAHCDNYY